MHLPKIFIRWGGTVHRDAPSYISRKADEELFNWLSQGEFCYVLDSRQIGKSSLMLQTAYRLRQQEFAAVIIDLTALGQNLKPEQWYFGLLCQVVREFERRGLDLEEEIDRYWDSHTEKGPMQKWIDALHEIVLARFPGKLVIFIDELDAVRSLPFSTDEFFGGIRECYNRRTRESELQRLTFCLLGVASPSDLVLDSRTTPFNIGRRVEIKDFTPEEAAPLARGLGRDEALARQLLDRILYWSGGHPYLTQVLCRAVAQDPSVVRPAGVDRHCEGAFPFAASTRARRQPSFCQQAHAER